MQLGVDSFATIPARAPALSPAYFLFGYRLEDRDALCDEKLRLPLTLRDDRHPHWSGRLLHSIDLVGERVKPLLRS